MQISRQQVHRAARALVTMVFLARAASLSAQTATTTAPASIVPAHPVIAPRPAYLPHRVYDARKKRWIDFEALVQRANASELVFMGEQHDNGPGHAIELALLEGIARRRGAAGGPVVLSLEMFERDVQTTLDEYLAGKRTESDFLSQSRPWPNYGPDYRPLVELARASSWPVLAANIPRRMASMVSRGTLKVLDTLDTTTRGWAARRFDCPHDDYYKRFAQEMQGHGGPSGSGAADTAALAMTERFYQSQCAKDETMAESIVGALSRARERGAGALVVHMNGSFHSDYGMGTAARAKRDVKGVRTLVVSVVPTPNLDTVDAKAMRKLADVIVFTVQPPAPPAPAK